MSKPPQVSEPSDANTVQPAVRRPKDTLAYVILLLITIPLLLQRPPISTLAFAAIVLGSAGIALGNRKIRQIRFRLRLPQIAISVPTREFYSLEIAIILIVLALATRNFQNWQTDRRVSGSEFSYLINSGVIAANVYHKSGAIPLWNPFMGRGEPLFENPFSFVLNPLMTLPIFWFGAITGTKVAVLLHVGLMGLGGWVLGLVLRLKMPSRMVLALLLGGSGSMAGAIGMGFYQMSLSQAYVPWVYAGLLGIIYRQQRTFIALMVVAGMLLIFAGTFWYVLPTAIGCLLLVLFHALKRDAQTKRLSVDIAMLARVAFAVLLMIVLSTARLLPQVLYFKFIDHPLELLNREPQSFLSALNLYFTSSPLPPFDNLAMFYHYILPLGFAVSLVAGRLLISMLGIYRESRWRILIPAVLLIVFFTVWGQGGTPFMQWLYNTFPLLKEWRFVGRMQAAASLWVAVAAALLLDNLVVVLWRNTTLPDDALLKRWRASPYQLSAFCGALLLALVILSAVSVNEIVHNWEAHTGTEVSSFPERAPLLYLRAQNPYAFIDVMTSGFFGYIPFYEAYARATFGNPDYHPIPLAPTIGTTDVMKFPPIYALGYGNEKYQAYLYEINFRVVPENDSLFLPNVLWKNRTAPPYLFTASVIELQMRRAPLDSSVTTPVSRFAHNIDTIDATLGDYAPGRVLVAQETAFPGWQVSIDGQPAQIESVGGLIGVRLPDKAAGAAPTHVVFAYRPLWFSVGAAITAISSIGMILYLLRIDRFLRRKRRE